MSISPTNAVSPLDVFQTVTGTRRSSAPAPSPAGSGDAVKVDSLPASPPEEVLAQMHTAAAAADALAADGRSVRFSTDPQTGRVTAALTDSDGTVISSLSLRDVLAVAGGATPS